VRGCAGRWEAAADGGGGAPGSGEKAALGFRPRTNASTRLFLKFLGGGFSDYHAHKPFSKDAKLERGPFVDCSSTTKSHILRHSVVAHCTSAK
jgi:hypothetical protein